MGIRAKTAVLLAMAAVVGLSAAAAVSEAAAPASPAASRAAMLAAAVAVSCVVVVALLWLRTVTRALESLRAAASSLLGGRDQLSDRAALALLAQRADEVGDLGAALVELARQHESSIARLDAERDLYLAILDGMREGIVVTDAEGLVTLTNRALRETLGLEHDLRGREPLEVGRIPELAEVLDRATREGPCAAEAEVPEPRRRTLLLSAAPLPDTHAGAVAVAHDITELRRLERVRRDFVANVSHELRTPITSVLAAAETLQGEALTRPEVAARFVASIHRNAARLAAIVEDLLRLSKIESGRWKYELVEVPVRAMAERVVELASSAAGARRIALLVEVADGTLAVRADEAALQLVLANLVDNAVKYSHEGGAVRITAELADKGVAISLHDQGIGIEAPVQDRIFERFYRVDKGRSREAGGTGLGLSIVKNLVQGMGGEVTVRSEPGRGSTFTVTLPRGRGDGVE
jgi:two-component system phosphate regulon sensor histidine kinase PhoR